MVPQLKYTFIFCVYNTMDFNGRDKMQPEGGRVGDRTVFSSQ